MKLVVGGTEEGLASVKVSQHAKIRVETLDFDSFLASLTNSGDDQDTYHLWLYSLPWDALAAIPPHDDADELRWLDSWKQLVERVLERSNGMPRCFLIDTRKLNPDELRAKIAVPKSLITVRAISIKTAADAEGIRSVIEHCRPEFRLLAARLQQQALVPPSASTIEPGDSGAVDSVVTRLMRRFSAQASGPVSDSSTRYEQLMARFHSEQEAMEKQVVMLMNEIQQGSDEMLRERTRATKFKAQLDELNQKLSQESEQHTKHDVKYEKLLAECNNLSASLLDAEEAAAYASSLHDQLQRESSKLEAELSSARNLIADLSASGFDSDSGLQKEAELSRIRTEQELELIELRAKLELETEIANSLAMQLDSLKTNSQFETTELHRTQEMLEQREIMLSDLKAVANDASEVVIWARAALVHALTTGRTDQR